jgi:UDP-glucose 4-epimerase
MKKILITGGAGFIGSNLAKELTQEGHKVVIIDDFSYGSMFNLIQDGKPIAEIHPTSICDKELIEIMKGVDYVYHLAAISCLPICLSQPYSATNVNVAGTLNVLEAARLNNVKKVIFASSSAVYENSETFPSKEEDEISPHSIYSVHKYTGELFCKSYRKLYNMDIPIVRFFNVYGPNQDYSRQKPPVMSYLIRELLEKRTPITYGTGEQKRDFIFIEDVISALKLIIVKDESKNETFNVGSGKVYSINEIYNEIDNVLKTGIKQIRKNPEEMYEGIDKIQEGNSIKSEIISHETNKFTQADISKAKRLLGWEPKTDLKEGILASVDFVQRMLKNF